MHASYEALLQEALAAFMMSDEERPLHFNSREWCTRVRSLLAQASADPPGGVVTGSYDVGMLLAENEQLRAQLACLQPRTEGELKMMDTYATTGKAGVTE